MRPFLVGLFGSVAVCIAILGIAVPAAHAQTATEDGEPVLMKADELVYERDLGLVVAKGDVEIMQGPRILLADTVSYNQKTNTVTASGNVRLLEPTGEVFFADYVELSDDMKNGVVENIRLRLSDDSRIAANAGKRTDGVRTEMRQAMYSPCESCEDNPDRAPLWQVKARRVVHDKEAREVRYHDAWLEMWGMPVAYTPYFEHADPTVKRKTGFLTPGYGSSSNVGAFVEVPFFFAIADDKDATLRPIYTSDDGLVYSGEYRQRFDNGEFQISGSMAIADRDSGEEGNVTTNKNEFRGHVFSKARWDINDTWRTGADIQRATDRTYLRRFNFFGGAGNVLTSNAFLEGFRRRNYVGVDAWWFQDLRLGLRPDTKLILPIAEYSGLTEADRFGGRWNFDGNFRSLYVDDSPQSQRGSLKAGYSLPLVAPIGLITTLSATARGDLYYVDYNTSDKDNGFEGRFAPAAKADMRMPFGRQSGDFYQMIQPIAGVVVTPTNLNDRDIPNDDSTVVEEDDTNLTSLDRAPGLDRVEEGARVYYGLGAGMYDPWGGVVRGFIGQSYRFSDDTRLQTEAGLNRNFSDFVGHVELVPNRYMDVLYRYQLNETNLNPNVSELSFKVGPEALRLSGDYIFVRNEPNADEFRTREEITLAASSQIDEWWRWTASYRRDLDEDESRRAGFGLTYEDECFILHGNWDRDFTADTDVSSGDTFFFRVTFKTLGSLESGSIQSDVISSSGT